MTTKKTTTTKAVQAITPLEAELIKGAGLPANNAKELLEQYGPELKEAGVMLTDYKLIVITSEDDKAGMEKAEADRKKLKKLRLAISASHKELKAPALARGNAIDYIKRRALAEIEPVETHLLEQERFAERKQAERVLAKVTLRVNELSQYVDDTSIYNFAEMADQAYDDLLADAKNTKALKEKAEAERIKAEQAEQARIDAARREIADRDRKAREKAEAELALSIELLNKEKAEQAKKDAEVARQRVEEQAILEAERAKREELEKAEAQRLLAEEEADRLAKLEAEKLASAPDKEKLLAHIEALYNLSREWHVTTDKAYKVGSRIESHMSQNIEMYRKLIGEEL